MSDEPKKPAEKLTPSPKKDPNEIDVDPATLLAIIAALILVPLIVTGFIAQ